MGVGCTNEINARLPGRDRYRPLISPYGSSFRLSSVFRRIDVWSAPKPKSSFPLVRVPGESFQTAGARCSVK